MSTLSDEHIEEHSEIDNEEVQSDDDCFFVESDYKEALRYVRSISKYFRKSPMKNSVLQDIIKSHEGCELKLLLDIRLRWNSILPMIKRYLQVKNYIFESLEHFDCTEKFSSLHDDTLLEFVEVLEPVQHVVLTLSSANSNLIVAEASMDYLLKKLTVLDSNLSRKMFQCIQTRYLDRRNKDIVSLMMFLQSGSYPQSNDLFEYSSKYVIKQRANEIASRMLPIEVSSAEKQQDSAPNAAVENFPQESELQRVIHEFMKPSKRCETGDLTKDFRILEATKQKSSRLTDIQNALFSLQPTSTECERAFSVAGIFKNKLRNRMSPEKLNYLLWLKYYFKKNENE